MYTLAGVHRFDGPDQQLAVALHVLDEHEQKFERSFRDQAELAGDQRVQPLDGRVVLHDAVHSIDVKHHLTQSF